MNTTETILTKDQISEQEADKHADDNGNFWCGGCGEHLPVSEMNLLYDGGTLPCRFCDPCLAEALMACQCTFNGDIADTTGCPAHGSDRKPVMAETQYDSQQEVA